MSSDRKTRRHAARAWVRAEARKFRARLGTPVRFEEAPGVAFHAVGFNASHEFYFGWDAEGGLWSAASGEEGWDEINDVPLYGTSVRRIADPNDPGYCGHW